MVLQVEDEVKLMKFLGGVKEAAVVFGRVKEAAVVFLG